MSGEFAKTMLKVGTYHSPDGEVVVTPQRLKHWERQVRAIQSVGYAIPSHFDHANDLDLLEPISEADLQAKGTSKAKRSAQFTVGKLKSFQVTPDGQAAEIVLHTLDPKATSKVASNAVYVSPVVHPSWKDGAGNKYDDALTSFDLVDWPVDHSQSSFTPLIRMGQRVCPAIRMGASKPYTLESSGMSKVTKNRSVAARQARFKAALKAGLMVMGSEYQPDDDEANKKPTDDAASDSDGSSSTDGSDTATPSDDTSPTDTVGVDNAQAPDLLDSVLNLLHEHGVTLPDDTTDDTLVNHLRVALTALLSRQDDESEADGMGDEPNELPQPVAPQIATMSVQQRKLLDRAAIAEKALAEKQRKDVSNRLASLLKSGRCTPAEHDAQLRTLGMVRMSMTDSGDFKPTRVDFFLEDRESVPEGTYWTDKQRSEAVQKLSVVAPPDSITRGGGRSRNEYAEAVRALGGDPDK